MSEIPSPCLRRRSRHSPGGGDAAAPLVVRGVGRCSTSLGGDEGNGFGRPREDDGTWSIASSAATASPRVVACSCSIVTSPSPRSNSGSGCRRPLPCHDDEAGDAIGSAPRSCDRDEVGGTIWEVFGISSAVKGATPRSPLPWPPPPGTARAAAACRGSDDDSSLSIASSFDAVSLC